MWIITKFGFFSVVAKPGDAEAGRLTVRSRVLSDLEELRDRFLPSLGPTEVDKGTDYKFRATAPRADVAAAAAKAVEAIDYSNFKNEVHREQGSARASAYGEVWQVLYSLQTNEQ